MRPITWVIGFWLISTVQSFHGAPGGVLSQNHVVTISSKRTTSHTALWGTAKRTARRDLQKRRRRNKLINNPSGTVSSSANHNSDEALWKISEIRPLIKSEAREQGADYWIDEEDLRKYNESLRRRPREVGQVPDEKLWKEVLSPYRENWIGLFSVLIVVIATIVLNFPELLQYPVIDIPDL